MVKLLHNAKKQKKDEFYTLRADIEDELFYYRKYLKGKVVFCNCDDPEQSNFWHYLRANFDEFKLKKLISTHYKPSLLFEDSEAYMKVYDGKKEEDADISGDGDFRSPECVKLLKESNVVITNPPFSLFRDYVEQLMTHKKKFIIVGNMQAITYKEIFPLIQENRLWLGASGIGKEFKMSKDYVITSKSGRVDEEGNKYVTMPTACWFTNLKHNKRETKMILGRSIKEDAELYVKYDNYDAIEVSKVKNIPKDYDGVMGVPISFLDKYNPDQFEILGATQRGCHDRVPDTKKYNDYWEMRPDGTETGSSGNKTNENANVEGIYKESNNYFVNKKGHVIQSKFGRLFIRNLEVEK